MAFLKAKCPGAPTAQGNEKMEKENPCQGKHREFGRFAKTQGKDWELGMLK